MADLAKLVDELSSLKLLEAVELAKLLEEKWERPTGEPAATEAKGLKFNEGLACEAIVRHLESRQNGVRADLCFPEKEGSKLAISSTPLNIRALNRSKVTCGWKPKQAGFSIRSRMR
jgi:hypothetical protein